MKQTTLEQKLARKAKTNTRVKNLIIGGTLAVGTVIGGLKLADYVSQHAGVPVPQVTIRYIDTNDNGLYDHVLFGDTYTYLGSNTDKPLELSRERIENTVYTAPNETLAFESLSQYGY